MPFKWLESTVFSSRVAVNDIDASNCDWSVASPSTQMSPDNGCDIAGPSNSDERIVAGLRPDSCNRWGRLMGSTPVDVAVDGVVGGVVEVDCSLRLRYSLIDSLRLGVGGANDWVSVGFRRGSLHCCVRETTGLVHVGDGIKSDAAVALTTAVAASKCGLL